MPIPRGLWKRAVINNENANVLFQTFRRYTCSYHYHISQSVFMNDLFACLCCLVIRIVSAMPASNRCKNICYSQSSLHWKQYQRYSREIKYNFIVDVNYLCSIISLLHMSQSESAGIQIPAETRRWHVNLTLAHRLPTLKQHYYDTVNIQTQGILKLVKYTCLTPSLPCMTEISVVIRQVT